MEKLVLVNTNCSCSHDICFQQKYEKYQSFLYKNFQFLVVKFSIYLNRHVLLVPRKILVKKKQLYYKSLPFFTISKCSLLPDSYSIT